MIKYALAKLLETAINQALALDLYAKKYLTRHHGKVLQLNISTLQLVLYFAIHSEKISVQTLFGDRPDTIITGDIFAFLKQLHRSHEVSKLNIEGDVEFAHDIQRVLQNLSINWEEYFS